MSIFSSTAHIERTGPPDGPVPTRPTVPWKTVIALAVVLAYADGFWLTSLRGAIGAIERSQSPFLSWLQESAVVVPVFVLAVLGALTLAKRWFGPELHRVRTLVATVLLIVAASTLVGLLVTVASSLYDFHLQSHQIVMMAANGAMSQDALAEMRHTTLAMHVHGVVYISGWLILTNLALVAWLVGLWSGRLKLTTQHPAPHRGRFSQHGLGVNRAQDLRLLLVATLLASAVIHLAVLPTHLSNWSAVGMVLLLLVVWELVVGVLLLARLEEGIVLFAAAAVSVGPLLLWLWSRSAALLFGPESGAAEGLGLPGLAASALAVVSLIAALTLLRGGSRLHGTPGSAHVRGLFMVGLVALTVIGLAGAGLSWLDPFGISDVLPAMIMPQ